MKHKFIEEIKNAGVNWEDCGSGKMREQTDLFIRDARAICTSFHELGGRGSKAITTRQELAITFINYLKANFEIINCFHELDLQFEGEYYLSYEVQRAFDSVIFFVRHFRLDENLTKKTFVTMVNDAACLLQNNGYQSISRKLLKQHVKARKNSPIDVFHQIIEIVQPLYEISYQSPLFIQEMVNKLQDILIGYFAQAFEEDTPDYNQVTLVFASVLHVLHSNRLDELLDKEINLIDLNNYPIGDNFSAYLQAISEYDMERAIELCPDYEFPHYYNLLSSLSHAPSAQKLLKEQGEKLVESITKGGKLLLRIESIYPSGCFPVLDDLNLKGFDFVEFFLEATIFQQSLKASLQERYDEITELQQQNSLMVKRYSHIWTNLLHPDLVLNVAKSLKSSTKHKDYIDLMRAYNNEVLLKHQSQMLELRHAGNSLALKRYIRKGICDSKDAVTVSFLINYSLERICFRMLFDNNSRMEGIRTKLIAVGKDVDDLAIRFSELTLLGEDPNYIVSFVNQHIVPYHITSDDNWSKIKVLKDSGAAAFLVEVFSEIFLNAVSHGKMQEPGIFLSLSSVTNSIDMLTIDAVNPVSEQGIVNDSLGSGLSSLKFLLQFINCSDRKNVHMGESLTTKSEQGLFTIRINLRKDLLCYDKGVLVR